MHVVCMLAGKLYQFIKLHPQDVSSKLLVGNQMRVPYPVPFGPFGKGKVETSIRNTVSFIAASSASWPA